LNSVVLAGIVNGRHPSVLVLVTAAAGAAAADAVVPVEPEAVLPVAAWPVGAAAVLVDPELPLDVPELALVPELEVAAAVVDEVVPEAGSVVDIAAGEPAESAELLDPQALSAPRHVIVITGRKEPKDLGARSMVTCFHRCRESADGK
jgi:hypothetical protein